MREGGFEREVGGMEGRERREKEAEREREEGGK